MYYKTNAFAVFQREDIEDPVALLYDGGVERREKENYYFQNWDRFGYEGYLIQYTLSGRGIFEKEGIRREITAGQGFCVRFPEESCYYLEPEQEDPWEFFYLHFGGNGIRGYVDQLMKEDQGVFFVKESSESVRLFFQLHEKMCAGGHMEKYEGSEFVFRFLCTLLRESQKQAQTENGSLVQQASLVMEREYDSLEGIRQLAESLGVSHEHLCRVFRREKHMTPGQYLTSLRIQGAMNDLLNSEDTMEIIAAKNGFSNANYFEKVFKKYVNSTPARYRELRQGS